MLYGCETWSLTLREECRIRISENMILRQKFGPERHGNWEWKGLHNEQFYSLYRSPNLIRVIMSRRWGSHVVIIEEYSALKSLTDKPARKRPLTRSRRNWEDNIVMDLK